MKQTKTLKKDATTTKAYLKYTKKETIGYYPLQKNTSFYDFLWINSLLEDFGNLEVY